MVVATDNRPIGLVSRCDVTEGDEVEIGINYTVPWTPTLREEGYWHVYKACVSDLMEAAPAGRLESAIDVSDSFRSVGSSRDRSPVVEDLQ
ncbi:hypothetical protein OPT61_g6743 [Boeremia exigua]|uniref:Uncharacterized protein n=1 Tax=Boeremia exigua TaxID=749465 RepID=A0ACC2I533_9PLEO|nr:hypothetical protein OPT61_g6743 [Boeremia exigua]